MTTSFNKSPFSFNAPGKMKKSFDNHDMLFNKKKISQDVISMSSASSVSSRSSSKASSKSGTGSSYSQDNNYNKPYNKKNKYEEESVKSFGEDDEDDESMEDDNEDDDIQYDRDGDGEHQDHYDTFRKDKKQIIMNELNEKRDLLYQMDRLESKGYRLPFKFNMDSDLDEMRNEYNKIVREKEIDASIRFQRKMMMAFVTGSEYMNSRYDPFAIRLEGWSEQVHETITDYDDIFEELHSKYKSTGKKMSPELRLFISLSGSAFMFHLTNRMFKENPLPNVENVLKSNPELMKQFQAAAAKQYVTGQGNTLPPSQSQVPQGADMNSGLFGMVSNLFNNLGGGSSRQQQMYEEDEVPSRKYNRPNKDIDNIINNVHDKISFDQDQNNIETLSVSDEEITSIIEDTADIRILKNTKNKNTRTLNL